MFRAENLSFIRIPKSFERDDLNDLLMISPLLAKFSAYFVGDIVSVIPSNRCVESVL